MIVENEQFVFVVTHVEADGQFLKIWAQTDERIVQSVASLLIPLQEKFDYYDHTSNILSPDSLVPHTRCCARGRNNDFARAKILGSRSDSMVLVQFVDYGNIAYVPINNIRLLDRLPEANYLFALPEAASVFVLADIAPIGGTWMDDVVDGIRSILVNNQYYGIYQNVGNYKTIKFLMMKEDFGQILISRNMALYSPPNTKNIQQKISSSIPIQPLRTPHQSSNVLQDNWRMPTAQNVAPVQKVVKTNSFKAIQLEIGSVHDVQVSFVEEGPCKFSVQLLESIPYLDDMMAKINSQSHPPLQEPPIAGTVCLGLQTHTKRLCRVVLNSPGDTSCKVYYADYGHHEVLSFTSIYQIPDEFVVPNIFSIRFTLSDIINWNVSQDMKDYFGGLVHEKKLKLRVCKGPMSPLTQYCDLFWNGKNIKDILSETFPESCEFTYSEPKRLQNGTREIVFVTYVESPAKFFVQIEKDLKSLDEVMDRIEQVSKTAAKLTSCQIRSEMPCIALYDVDQKWYRASIQRVVDGNKILVFYVDFGNEEVVLMNNLRTIPSELVKVLPKQAIKCSLNGFQSRTADKELVKNFEGLVLEERLCLMVLSNTSNTVIVDLYDGESASGSASQDIAGKLKALEISKRQELATSERHTERNPETFKPLQGKNQNDNWTGNWEKEGNQGQSNKTNNVEPYETAKTKFRKDNENEQRHDNRFRKGSSDYSNGPQNNRFEKEGVKHERFNQNDRFSKNNDFHGTSGSKDYSASNDRFNRGGLRNNTFDTNDFHAGRAGKENQGNRSSVNSRLDRSFGSDKTGSDKDSDTSSRSGGRRSNRGGRRNGEDQRKRDSPANNRNRIGRWENEEREHETYRKNYNGDANTNLAKSKSSRDNNTSNFDKSKSSEWDISAKMSTSCKDTTRYLTSTPIFKIPPPNITIGAIKNCTMVYYTNPSSFYVQLCPDNEELNSIMEKIYSIYDNGGKVFQPSEIKDDLQCIAQYSEDEQWYRAVVKSVETSSATVHFIDYGNVETISFQKIKEIEPEFLKLPAQAIHCKLFCPSKLNWTKEESDRLVAETDDKLLEAEFVTEENGTYNILIKEVKPDDSTVIKYINDLFTDGIDLVKEKETVRNKMRTTVRGERSTPPDYTSLEEKWLDNKLDLGTKYDVLLAWFINPENFYCQLASQQKAFREMMNEIQTTYAKRIPVSEPLKVGSSVIAVLPDDGVLYRAEVLELNKPRGHVVQYIDYGDRAMVDPRKIYPVERKFRTLPKQAIFCGLKNIAPPSGSKWANSTEMSKFFAAEKFDCIFHEFKNDKYLISLNGNGIDVGSSLVNKNLAVISSISTDEIANGLAESSIKPQEVSRIDINLLEGQILYVKVSSVEGVGKFYVQFYTAEGCQSAVDTFMANQNPQVMPRLLCHEVCLGAGCLVYCREKWRRGVVVNFTKSNYEIRLIDTGEHEKIILNNMLGLPGQLSIMQNQAIECALFDVPLSSKADDMLKRTVTEKDVKIFVEKVECNRLVVRLFDINGNKIKVVDTQNTERINPVCSMQILSSTHDVTVTWIDNSNSVWLKRSSETALEEELLNNLFNYYSEVQASVVPEENKLYAGLSSDGNWYRVKVMKIKGDTVTVTLIDYGNIEDIRVEDLRTLEAQFYLPHQLGIQVSLTVSLAGSDASQKDILIPLLEDRVFTATFYNVNRKWLAELSENGDKLSDKLGKLEIVKETTKTQFEYVELTEMIVGEKYNVVVSHVDTPNQLWLQRNEELDAIAELQKQLQEASSLYLDCNGIPEEKSLCLAMYSLDSLWYRAEVLDADADITTVRFIDYGNTDVIGNSVNHLKQLPDKWKVIKKYAIQCKLDVVPANADDWTDEGCVRIADLTAEHTLQALIIADKAPMRIDLFYEGQSICKVLVDEKLAAYVQSSEELEGEIVEEVQLDPRSAFVSHMISIDQFWVQEEKWVNDLEMMADRLMMSSICFPPLLEIKEGLTCIAYFPDDNLYYRATILSHNEEGTKVRYIDYGNSAVSKDLRTIPEDLAALPPLSRKCCLAKPDGIEHWPDDVNEEFVKLAADGATVFLLDVIEEGETCIVRLTHDAKDVAVELLELCSKSVLMDDEGIVVEEVKDIITEERPSPIGEENSSSDDVCTVSYVISPSEFWTHKKSQYQELDGIMDRLYEAETFHAISEIKEGKIVAAKFDEDNLWYRSKILSRGECGTEVLYIDYGNSAVAESEAALRELPEDLALIPPVAMHCSLKKPEELENWSKSACEKFIDLVANGAAEFKFQILDRTSLPGADQPTQVLFFYEDQDVVDILLNHEKKLQSSQDVGIENGEHESKELKDRNSSGDSAIQSEVEQQATDTDIQNSRSFANASAAIEDISGSVEIICVKGLCSTEISLQAETVISKQLDVKSEKSDSRNENEILTDKDSTDVTESDEHKNTINQEKKIVPGSISRGISDEEIARFSPTHRCSSPEEKIVPGSINKGEVYMEVISTETDEQHVKTKEVHPENPNEFTQSTISSPSFSHDERVVPSCISKGETPIDLERPTTPRTTHEEKLVAGAVNAQMTLEYEESDEIITIEVNKDIPES